MFIFLPRVYADTLSMVGGVPVDMVFIPAGWFVMGSSSGENDEKPVHKVFVDSFFMEKSEVTVWEYLECVHAGACRMPLWWNKKFFNNQADDIPGNKWLAMPVVGVSWDNAQDFCAWKGTGYRLPTEAEWEYAARAGSTSEYFWGNTMDSAAEYAVIDKGISPVMTRKPNAWGLYDMIGNAWEWCQDRYDKNYYKKSPERNPTGPGDSESKKYPYRVVRGGEWNEYRWNLRCANRNYGEEFRRFNGVGFRICRSIGKNDGK
ncbi:MAG: formylglycine-generating enzyme family protein [Chitinivibrionales bacterium]|nr:formylglycine-generating enzyme family protein [Chitinivibrionales bacterium]